jgi:class 3 adenylate cyclase/tetratricopeptide (TPR) repeat protein
MQCPQCQYEPPADAKFCPECGSKLAILCVQCWTANDPGHKFCKQCGQPLASASAQVPGATTVASPQSYTPKYLAEKILTSRSTLEGERKEVTVLFCDVVDSTRLAERLGPEAMHRLMDRALRLMADAVHRYEGTVNQFLGDGLMALFGAPLALEDHALRAILTALMIQEVINGYNEELKSERDVAIRLRLGLNTGLVVVGRIGDDLRMDYTAVGDATNVAARMQGLAEPGTILITEATHRLVEGHIRSQVLGPVQVKGRCEPILVYKVTGRRQRSRLEVSLARGLTPLVGRDREFACLHDCLARVQTGRGQVVGIVGEAGVGKSRLLYEFRKVLAGERITWLEGHCVAYGHDTPYLPLLEILRANFHIEEGDTPLQIQEKLRQGLRQLDLPLEESLPLLGELFGLPGADAALTRLHPHLKQWKTFEALRGLMVAGSQRRPHAIVLEDLHWLDQTSEAYLTFLIESLAGMPVLLITTHRPGYAARWTTKTYYTHITLDLLTGQEAEELLGTLLGADAGLDPVKQLLLDRTEGNPFFLEESVRMLVESQVLVGERGAYRLGKPFQTIQIPATVQAVLAARIDRLPPAEKELLQIAAVIGKRFPLALLQVVTDQPEEALRHGLAYLQAAEFVHETSLFPEVQYAFTHTLTYDVAYGSLLQEQQRALHAQIVEAIEALYADRLAEWADQLAHHVVRGEVWSKAPAYFHQGLMNASPSMDASFWWMGEHDRAIELSRHDFTITAEFKNFPGQVITNFRLGQAYHALGDYPRAIECLRWNVASLKDDLLRECFDLPGFASVLSQAWLSWCLSERGEFIEGMALAEEAVEIAETADHPYSRSIACLGMGHLYLQKGELHQAMAVFERGLSCSQAANLPELFPLLAAPLGSTYALCGQISTALPLLEQAVERAASMQCLGLQARRVARLSEAYLLAGRRDEATVLVQRALELASVHKERGHQAWALRLLGEIASHGAPPEITQAEASYHQAMALTEELGMRPLLAHCQLGLGTLYSRIGGAEPAGAALSAATDLYRAMEMTLWLSQAEAALLQVT